MMILERRMRLNGSKTECARLKCLPACLKSGSARFAGKLHRTRQCSEFSHPALAIALNTVRERAIAIGYQAARPRSTARLTCQTMAMGVLGMRHNEWEVGGEEGLCQAPPLCEGSEEPLGKYPIGQSL
ncbi:hypothetical protein NW754_012246 [Fusarium falciforme]|nr:hypothetical protein NW754_012246 [Fusarium falciforme]